MVQTESSAHVADDWYLVANRNNLTIKIVNYITIGESDGGMLVLDSRVEAERWLTLEVDPAGCLNVVYQDPRCRLTCPDRWVADSAGAVLPRCTMLELPNNKIYVSQQLQRGSIEQNVIVTCHNPTELETKRHLFGDASSASLPLRAESSEDVAPSPLETPAGEREQEIVVNEVSAEPVRKDLSEASDPIPDEPVSEVVPEANEDEQKLASAISEVVMAPEVLDQMLRQLEESGSAGQVEVNLADVVVSESDRGETVESDSEIPLLQDVADVYLFEGTLNAERVKPSHAFEVVAGSGDENVADAKIRPAVESVYARPSRRKGGRVFLVSLIAVLMVAGLAYGLIQPSDQTEADHSPFKDQSGLFDWLD
ncbi:MAG: hypothetical protein AAF541_20570 [Pseudomonadota bacterium]